MFKQWIFCDIISLSEPGQLLLAIRGKGLSEAFKKIVAGSTLRREIVTEFFRISGIIGLTWKWLRG